VHQSENPPNPEAGVAVLMMLDLGPIDRFLASNNLLPAGCSPAATSGAVFHVSLRLAKASHG
jgi:hypothetical protein